MNKIINSKIVTLAEPNKFKCGVCGKLYTSKPGTRYHIAVTHIKADDQPYVCQFCPDQTQRFALKYMYKFHLQQKHK